RPRSYAARASADLVDTPSPVMSVAVMHSSGVSPFRELLRADESPRTAYASARPPRERRHDLGGEPLELLQHKRLRRAYGMTDRHALEPRILLLQVHQRVDDLLRRAAEGGAASVRFVDRGQAGVGCFFRVGHRIDLLLRQRADQPQWTEHLEVLFEISRGGFDGLFLRRGELEVESDAQPFAQLGRAPGAAVRIAVGLDDATHRSALGHAAPDEPLDPVLGHEVQTARCRALDRLPALDGMDGPRHEREVLQIVAAIRNTGGDRVVLALVRE